MRPSFEQGMEGSFDSVVDFQLLLDGVGFSVFVEDCRSPLPPTQNCLGGQLFHC